MVIPEIPFFDSPNSALIEAQEEDRQILIEYLKSLPLSVQAILRTVLLVDSKLIGYELSENDLVQLLLHKNTLSEHVVRKIVHFLQLDGVSDLVFSRARERLSDVKIIDGEEKDTTDRSLTINASSGFNRFYMYPNGGGQLFLAGQTLTNSSGTDVTELKRLHGFKLHPEDF